VETSAGGVLEIGLILVFATAAGFAARRVGLPAVLGYLAVGLVVSPFTPGYSIHRDQLQVLADLGVVLLLFEVGIEINPLRLRHEHGPLLWAVPLQTVLTTAVGFGISLAMGVGVKGALIMGLAIALSSSVVVVNITRSRRRTTNPPTEGALLGWSVLQDVCGVAMGMGLLASVEPHARPVPVIVGGITGYVLVALAAAYALPRLLRALRSYPDLFLMLSVASGLALAGIGAVVFGVPLALAAFVAGLGLSEGPDAAEARLRLLPFRDLFAVMFFVAIGTLVDPRSIPAAFAWTAVILGLVVAAKVGVIYGLARLQRRPDVHAGQLAIGLGQVGEFSFVLASAAVARGALPAEAYTALLVCVVLTIAASTVLVRVPRLAAA
jgi:CPA2 family monovalent cation:H+ antiporter-2